MKKDKGFYDMHQPMSKTQPGKADSPSFDGSQRNGSYHGDGKDFNIKGKVGSAESYYHDYGNVNSGLCGNFEDKDKSIAYLTERGKKGMEVRHFNGTHENAKLHTYNSGPTAYNSKPIDQVYAPATSRNVPPPNAVIRPYLKKEETSVPDKSQEDITERI